MTRPGQLLGHLPCGAPRRSGAVLTAALGAAVVMWAWACGRVAAGDGFSAGPRRLVERYCGGCHTGEAAESGIDLAAFRGLDDLRHDLKTWQRVARVLADGDMPPADAEQPTAAESAELAGWVRSFLAAEAAARAGDPGPVVLRRLSNAEYTYSIRDLTLVDALDPAREFPVDGGAGEGFQNTGQSLVMSPTLVTKYLDAAKHVAAHAVLLPDGIRFSPSTDRGDWIDQALARLRALYGRYTVSRGDVPTLSKQGIALDAGHEGFIPVERYVETTLVARDRLRAGEAGIAAVALERQLSPKYLGIVWRALAAGTDADREPSPLVDHLRSVWQAGGQDAAAAIAAQIAVWQGALWRFNAVGHIARDLGRRGGPPAWLEPVSPLAERQEFRMPLTGGDGSVTVRLSAADAGDGETDDLVVWRRPRIVVPGGVEVPARDALRLARERLPRRRIIADQCAACLGVVDRVMAAGGPPPTRSAWGELAREHGVDPLVLSAWAARVGFDLDAAPATDCGDLLVDASAALDGRAGVAAWTGPSALAVVANASAETVMIPGTIAAGQMAVHPAPTRRVVVGWRALSAGGHRVEASLARAHAGCGNGIAWGIEWRRGRYRQLLAEGRLEADSAGSFASDADLPLLPGDMICLVVEPIAGDHACDMSTVSFEVSDGTRRWNLAADVAADLPAGNPHADAAGNPGVWHFASEPTGPAGDEVVPAGSLLARWQSAAPGPDRAALAADLQRLLTGPAPPADEPDGALHRRLLSLAGRLIAAADPGEAGGASDPRFGGSVGGHPVDPLDIGMAAPATLDLELAGDFGGEFVVTAEIHPRAGSQATVQVTAADRGAPPPSGWPGPTAGAAFLARAGTGGWERLERAFAAHRSLFPPAACYARIVPVDEVVTFNLLYREDDRLRELLIDEAEAAELDGLWEELRFVSDEPLELLKVYEQLMEYATQDANTLREEFLPVRAALETRVEAFQRQRLAAESRHLDAVVRFAERAYRRPLPPAEADRIRQLHAGLRSAGLAHEEAVRLVIARVLVSPEFLYKAETPAAGRAPGPLNAHELAVRLSYFLWSSLPDDELLRAAAAGRLDEPDALVAQARRMMTDPRIRRLATEFGTHWLHVADFAAHDEKSPTVFPEFAAVRAAMFEEAVLLLTDLFRNDRTILSLLDADHTFLDGDLAALYGIPDVTGTAWRRVDGVRHYGRGGILTLGATLAKQSGASRTSPILRGTWVTEVLLGERVPKPPKGVPPLPETAPEGLSERELTELHARDARCSGCHARFDPFGFALEGFDAIGRRRDKDVVGRPIDAAATLPDGTRVEGHHQLATYLAGARAADFQRHFCRKLLGYALGREIQLADEPLLDEMQARVTAAGGRVSAAVEAIVTSRQFRAIRGAEAEAVP